MPFSTSRQAPLQKARTMRVTVQRRAVLETVRNSRAHLSADQIWNQVRMMIPNISLATVYKALNEFKDVGKIRALPLSGKLRFDIEDGPGHHHLVCQRCGTVADVYATDGMTEPILSQTAGQGFEISATEITFKGLCPSCQNGSATSTR